MSDSKGIPHSALAVATALRERAVQVADVQSELAKKLGEINLHWLERIQESSTDACQLLFRCAGSPAVGDKIRLCEQWIESAMKKAVDDAIYVSDSAIALGDLEFRVFIPVRATAKNTSQEVARLGST